MPVPYMCKARNCPDCSIQSSDTMQRHPLQRRHNGLDGVSYHQSHDCLLSRLFGRRSKKTSKLRVTGLCAGNSPGTGTRGQYRGKCFHLMTSSWLFRGVFSNLRSCVFIGQMILFTMAGHISWGIAGLYAVLNYWCQNKMQTPFSAVSWWRHQMETFSALLALCAGNSPVTGEFPSQRPVTRSFDVFFDLRLNKRLSKQSWGWWLETTSRSLWRRCNDLFQWKLCILIFIKTGARFFQRVQLRIRHHWFR